MWWTVHLKDADNGELTCCHLLCLHVPISVDVKLKSATVNFLQVTDMALAKDMLTNFEQYVGTNPSVKPGINLSVTVLRTGSWPSYKSSALNLPEEMVKCVEVFKGFYGSQMKDRKLVWIY